MKELKNLQLLGSNNKSILLDVFYKEDGIAKPIIIFSHGFKGFKDWGHFNYMAQLFAEAGFVFIKFNFSHNGTTIKNPLEFGDLEAFGNNNYIKELNDLQTVIDWTLACPELKTERDSGQLNLLGHSRGGGITILKAAEESRVTKVATWASVSDFINRNKQNTIEKWKQDGVVYAMNGRTKQNMPLYYQFYQCILDNRERLNIANAVKQMDKPLLIVHGSKDEAVAFSDAEELMRNTKQGQLLKIEGGNHTFGIGHPFNGELSSDAKEVIEKTITFFKTN